LNSGVSILQILHQVDETIWELPNSLGGNDITPQIKLHNLEVVVKGIQKFYEEMFDIKLPDDIIDLES
jgi:hypothetical protein